MKWVLRIVIAVVVLIAAVVITGLIIPEQHTVSLAIELAQPPEDVWDAITNYEAMPEWRSAVERVEPLPSGRPGWVEHTDMGPMALAIDAADPPRRLVISIADEDLPFSGVWTYELTPTGHGTRIRITEVGEVPNPVFRFMSRFIFGYRASMEHYLKDVGRKFGEEVEPA